jgi:hypothetical protein
MAGMLSSPMISALIIPNHDQHVGRTCIPSPPRAIALDGIVAALPFTAVSSSWTESLAAASSLHGLDTIGLEKFRARLSRSAWRPDLAVLNCGL